MIYDDIATLERLRLQSELSLHGPKYYGQALLNSKRNSQKSRDKKRRAKKRK